MNDIASSHPSILKRLNIKRFRALEDFSWLPSPNVNVILGGGDVGKTTILEAISLLLNPNSNYPLSDTDYYRREVENEFVIDGVFALSDLVPINQLRQMVWPWQWIANKLVSVPEESAPEGEEVYCFRVRGTADLELIHEVVQPDGEFCSFSTSIRRAIGLIKLSGDDRNDRDLRLVQGSALDRMLDDKNFRARASKELAKNNIQQLLEPTSLIQLQELGRTFKLKGLPNPTGLGLTGGTGLSLNALVGLTVPLAAGGTVLPLASWGSGTKRLAALTISSSLQQKAPITIIDEVERGLECYRQRELIKSLKEASAQVFLTTHSAASLQAASECTVWYLEVSGAIGSLYGPEVAQQLKNDPEAFLSKFTIVAEGITEVGFITTILEKSIGGPLGAHGIHVTDGGGNNRTLNLLKALQKSGLKFGGLADNEGTDTGAWTLLEKELGSNLCRWSKGCIEEEILQHVEEKDFETFIKDPDNVTNGDRLRTLAERLDLNDKTFSTIKEKAGAKLRDIIIGACCGSLPPNKDDRKKYKSHAGMWFKSMEGGKELAHKAMEAPIWGKLRPSLLPTINAVRMAVGLDIDDTL